MNINPMRGPSPTASSHCPPLHPRDWIAGLERGLAVIEAFDDQHPRMTAAQIGQRTGMTRTAARRYVLTLQHLGYITGDGKQYWLTPRVLRLGHSYIESARLPRLGQPFLQRIAAGTHDTAYLAVLDGDDSVYIARSGLNRNMNAGYVLGSRLPARVTAAGMLLLALMDDDAREAWLARQTLTAFTQFTVTSVERLRYELLHARAQDWILTEQLLELDWRGVAVPLRDRHGTVLGALNVTMPMRQESSQGVIKRVLPILQETAQSMRELI